MKKNKKKNGKKEENHFKMYWIKNVYVKIYVREITYMKNYVHSCAKKITMCVFFFYWRVYVRVNVWTQNNTKEEQTAADLLVLIRLFVIH